jgi:hypothetical protein
LTTSGERVAISFQIERRIFTMRGVWSIATVLLVMGVVASVAGINPPLYRSEGNEAYANTRKGATAMTLVITSPAFSPNEEIPAK